MKNNPSALDHVRRFSRAFILFFTFSAVLLVLCQSIAGQTKPTDGGTPLGLQAGAPAGSYSLGSGDNVNLYNGTLNYSLPLLRVGGRGSAGHTIVLPMERHWMVEKYEDNQANVWMYPIDGREEEIKPGYGPGIMAIRYGGIGSVTCEAHPGIQYGDSDHRFTATSTRLSFTGPGGTETEFRDVQKGGLAPPAQLCGNHEFESYGYNRGKVFVSVDGSQTTFISDADIRDQLIVPITIPESHLISGYLLLRDGTRYRIVDGSVMWIRDRNGNKISFAHDSSSRVTSITDSLNRSVTIDYDYNEGGSYGVCDKITYKGFKGTYGTSRVIRISKTTLSNVLRSGYSLTYVGYLFPNVGGSTSTYYNPTVVSSVWLPDGDGVTRRYQFRYNNYGELARAVLPTGGAFEYDYGGGTTDTSSGGGVIACYSQIYRRLLERRAYADGVNLTSRTSYSEPETQSSCGMTNTGYVTVEDRDASNVLLAKSKHYFLGGGAGSSLLNPISTHLTSGSEGREYETEALDTDGTTVLRRTVSTWQPGSPIAANPNAEINSRIADTTNTVDPTSANLVAKQTYFLRSIQQPDCGL